MRGMAQALESAERIASLGTLEVEWEIKQWAAIREA